MPAYVVPAVAPTADPILDAAKNFMQSTTFANQFMANAQSAMAPPDDGGGFGAAPVSGGGGGGYDATGMSPAALAAYDSLHGFYPDLTPTSAFRDAGHNAAVGGAKGSQHIHGNAYDFPTSGMSHDDVGAMIARAYESGFQGVGVYDNSVHFDVGPQRAWGPDYHRGSLPGWAAPYIRG